MARKAVNTETKASRGDKLKELSDLVKSWGKNKTECDALTKIVKADSAKIKSIMLDENLTESESDEYLAKLSFKHSEKFDEDGLIQFFKTVLWADKGSMECPYIKRVEVVDWDAVEKAIYNGTITKEQAAEMNKYKEVTTTPVLTLGKA